MITYIPSFRSIEVFSNVVIALSMTSHEKDFVDGVFVAFVVEAGDFVFKALPLGFLVGGVECGIPFV